MGRSDSLKQTLIQCRNLATVEIPANTKGVFVDRITKTPSTSISSSISSALPSQSNLNKKELPELLSKKINLKIKAIDGLEESLNAASPYEENVEIKLPCIVGGGNCLSVSNNNCDFKLDTSPRFYSFCKKDHRVKDLTESELANSINTFDLHGMLHEYLFALPESDFKTFTKKYAHIKLKSTSHTKEIFEGVISSFVAMVAFQMLPLELLIATEIILPFTLVAAVTVGGIVYYLRNSKKNGQGSFGKGMVICSAIVDHDLNKNFETETEFDKATTIQNLQSNKSSEKDLEFDISSNSCDSKKSFETGLYCNREPIVNSHIHYQPDIYDEYSCGSDSINDSNYDSDLIDKGIICGQPNGNDSAVFDSALFKDNSDDSSDSIYMNHICDQPDENESDACGSNGISGSDYVKISSDSSTKREASPTESHCFSQNINQSSESIDGFTLIGPAPEPLHKK